MELLNEADTCSRIIRPAMVAAGWVDDQIREQVHCKEGVTKGRIVLGGGKPRRRSAIKPDYLLSYQKRLPLAVVEAKAMRAKPDENITTAIQEAKDYALKLRLPFAYGMNGHLIREFDSTTGIETDLEAFPSPDALLHRALQAVTLNDASQNKPLLEKLNLQTGKTPRYYQEAAINRAVEAILQGKRRVLLTMATGTGKTTVSAQICWKLWNTAWNKNNTPGRRPKILFLADRTTLITDPYNKDFAIFGEARSYIQGGGITRSREIYFSTYQAIAEDASRPGLFREFGPDFFDLIIIDECHRGSARSTSTWRKILKYFHSAYQLGLTATPYREDENRDTYQYFGNPVFQYTLKEGLEDGFLAPYRVHRIVSNLDATGYRPSHGDTDRLGRAIPDHEYHTPDFEKEISFRERTEAVARHLTDFLKKTDRMAKTIVFCVDQEHANQTREALSKLNTDKLREYPNYVVRITSDDQKIGKGLLEKFQAPDIKRDSPIIVTTSELLSTGVDIETCKNIALFRTVPQMVEFKQIIGRGTRVKEEYNKLYFNILDYTGTATKNFADKDFDDEPAFISQEEIDAQGETIPDTILETSPAEEDIINPDTDEEIPYQDANHEIPMDEGERPPRKFYVDGVHVEILAHVVYDLDADGNQLSAQSYTDYSTKQVRTLIRNTQDLQAAWTTEEGRQDLLNQLADRGVDLDDLSEELDQPELDPFDLLCHLAFDTQLLTRRQRADALKRNKPDFFQQYGTQAGELLDELLDRYARHGLEALEIPKGLQVPYLEAKFGRAVPEITNLFGGPQRLRDAVQELKRLLYAA